MGKTIVYFIFLIYLVSIVYAADENFKFLYNPFTAKRDRSVSFNQTDKNWTFSNITATNIIGTFIGSSLDPTLWNFANNDSLVLDNVSILRIGNISNIRESLWDFSNNDSLVLDNATIIRTGNVSLLFSDKNTSLWNISGNNIFPREIGNNVGINITDPSHSLTVLGDILFNISGVDHFEIHADGISDDAIFIEMEPTVPGQSVIHAEIETDGIADVRYLTLDYLVTLVPEQFASAINLNFDVSGSTGGSIDAILVNRLGETDSSAEVHALSVEHGVNPIFQESGDALDMDIVMLNTTTGSFNITGNATTNSGDLPYNIEMFTTNGDTLMIGHSAQYSDIEFLLNVTASNPGIKPVFQHSATGGWKTFTPSDGTRGMRDSGVVRYEISDVGPDWIATFENNQTKFWIKIERTQGGGGLTPPIEEKIEVITTTVFEWDEEGDVFINSLKLSGDINYTGNNLTIQGLTGALHIFGTPDANNVFTVLDIHGNTSADNPEFRIHLKGEGRAIHAYESFMVTNTVGHLCSKDTTLVGCDTEITGPDLYVLDDFAYLGAGFLSNGTFNISDEGNLVTSGTVNITGDFRYFNGPVECTGNLRMTYTNGTTSICVETDPTASDDWNFANNLSNILNNDTIIRVGNLSIIFEAAWNLANASAINSSLWNRVGTNTILKNSGDNVGIGTTTPGAKLEVNGDFNITDGSAIIAAGAVTAGGTFQMTALDGRLLLSSAGPEIVFDDTDEGAGDKLFVIRYDAENLKFGSFTDAGTAFDRNNILILNRDGNVGIGTSSPQEELHILQGGTAGTPAITGDTILVLQSTSGSGSNAHLSIIAGTAGASRLFFGDTDAESRARIDYLHGTDTMRFQTAGADAMRIDSSGNVGIGTTSPNNRLHVAGNLEIRAETDALNTQVRFKTNNTQSVGTSATKITSQVSDEGGLAIVEGLKNGASDRFVDLILFGRQSTPTVISSHTPIGSPDTRTYTGTSQFINLQMGANTYDITVLVIQMGNPN